MEPLVAEPVSCCVVEEVMLSVEEVPVSLAARRSGVPIVPGAVVSTVRASAVVLAPPILPAVSSFSTVIA